MINFNFRHQKNLELKPNCLLTRYPIIFLSKTQLFGVNTLSSAAQLLEEHGYDVIEFNLTYFSRKKRVDFLMSFFELSKITKEKYYVISDVAYHKELERLPKQFKDLILNTWLLSNNEFFLCENTESPKKSGQWYKQINGSKPSFFARRSNLKTGKFLDWAISLAENELRC